MSKTVLSLGVQRSQKRLLTVIAAKGASLSHHSLKSQKQMHVSLFQIFKCKKYYASFFFHFPIVQDFVLMLHIAVCGFYSDKMQERCGYFFIVLQTLFLIMQCLYNCCIAFIQLDPKINKLFKGYILCPAAAPFRKQADQLIPNERAW